MTVRILIGDSRDKLRELPDGSVHCCVTSPPYFGLRDYGHPGQMGLEATPDEFVAGMVALFRDVRRVLRDDGTLWLNIGDSYNSNSDMTRNDVKAAAGLRELPRQQRAVLSCLKPKDLIGIPWRLAFALQADGWYLRQDIVWSKPNPMPESVRDRCTKAHEYIFLLSKSARYHFDAEAIAEPATFGPGSGWGDVPQGGFNDKGEIPGQGQRAFRAIRETRNKRSVWEVATQPFSGAHFATFPPALIEPCILAGCPEHVCSACGAPWERQVERTPMVLDRSERTHEKGRTRTSGTMLAPPTSKTLGFAPSCACDAPKARGVVLDPFGGAGTTGLVADRHQRDAILIELNPEYAALAQSRLSGDGGMFSEVLAA